MDTILVHSDQGSRFTRMDWAAFLKHHNLEHSISRRGNCHDNAVAESFFDLLKPKRIRRGTYRTREEARRDVFDGIEMFCQRAMVTMVSRRPERLTYDDPPRGSKRLRTALQGYFWRARSLRCDPDVPEPPFAERLIGFKLSDDGQMCRSSSFLPN